MDSSDRGAQDLYERGGIDISEAFIDGTFAGAKKGGSAVGKTKRGKGYVRRWKIERLFAWLLNYRRLTNRWERNAINFIGFVQLGCVCILLRHF